jgi:DNA-binding transcriptional ArsR family regulator
MKNSSDDVMMVKRDLLTMSHGFFAALSNPTRLGIIETLMEQPKHVKQIAAELKQEQSMISHNLRQLVNCHFVDVRREGKQRVYTLNYATIDPLIKVIENHCHVSCMDGEDCHLRQEFGDGIGA